MRLSRFRVLPIVLCASVCGGLMFGCGGAPPDRPASASPPESLPPASSPSTLPSSGPQATASNAAGPLAGRLVSRSSHAGRRHVELEVAAASLDSEGLSLQVTFSNRDTESWALMGDLGGADFLLVEAKGSFSSPRAFDPSLERLGMDGSLEPGASSTGRVLFAPPQGEEFELRFADFEALSLRLASNQDDEESPQTSQGSTAGAPPRTVRGKPSPPSRQERLEALLQRVLDAQAEALRTYDLNAYLETFVPSLRHRERQFFQNLRSLPLVDVDLQLLEALKTKRDTPLGRWLVELRYTLDGQPADNPFVHVMVVEWEIVDEAARMAEMELRPGRPVPWRRDGLAVHRSHHFLLVTEPRFDGELVDLAADAEAAYATLYRQGLPLASGYFVDLVADPERFARLAGRPNALGVAMSRQGSVGGEFVVDSRAFYVNGAVFSRLGRVGEEQRRITVTHELVHLALAQQTRRYTPIWLKEGAAVYFSEDLSYDRSRQLVDGGLQSIDLERLTAAPILGQHDLEGRRTADEYVYAGNVVAYLIEQRGARDLLRFYAAFAELSMRDLAALAQADAATQQAVLGDVAIGGGTHQEALAAALAPRLLQRYYDVEVAQLGREIEAWMRLKYR